MTAQELFDMLMAYPQPTRTEILNCTEEITRNYEPERVEVLLLDFADMLFQWQCDETYKRAKWEYDETERQHRAKYDEVYSVYEKKLHFAEYALAMGTNEPIEWPEEPEPYEPLPFIPPMPGTIAENIHIPAMYNYAVEVLQKKLDTTPYTCTAPTLPAVLDTPEAKAIFDRAKELGSMDYNFRWLQGKQYLACFARRMSLYLKLGKGLNPDNTPRINWQPFEKLFNMPPGKLRSNYNDVKGKYGENPEIERTLNELMP